MIRYEYKVVPAPQRGRRVRGVKSQDARFAVALEELMNELGEGGWEYLRADTLPCEEKSGFARRSMVHKTVMVFQRPLRDPAADTAPVPASEATDETGAAARLPGANREEPDARVSDEGTPDTPTLRFRSTDDSPADDERSVKLLTNRDHSFASYEGRPRLPGAHGRD